MVAAAKLLVLNPGEFELWKMRIEHSSSTNQAHGSNSTNIDSLSDFVIYSFFANQSNSPQFDNEDSQHIDVDDLEEMDLKWQMAMLTMRARRFLKKTRRKVGTNGSETIGFDKTKLECYNYHKRGHFTREYRALMENRNREPVRRNVTVETTDVKALVAQDGIRYDWSDQAKDGPTNFSLMAYTSSGSSSSDSEVSTCSKACLKSYETLKEHYDNLSKDYKKSQLNVGAYKTGLESVEARLVVYKKNKETFEENIKILKLDIHLRDNALAELRKKLEKAKKERDEIKITLEKFENSSKTLNNMLNSQVNDKNKTGVGYHAVPPPYTGNFMASKPDLILVDVDEYVVSESVTSVPNVAKNKAKTSESKPKSVSEPLIQQNSSRAVVSVNAARQINTAYPRPTVNSARPKAVLNAVKGNQVNDVKASTCWVWRPKHKVLDHVARNNGALITFKRFDYVDAQSRSKHMTGYISYVSEYEEIDVDMLPLEETPKENKEMNLFYKKQRIKREFSVARTSLQNGVTKRKNRTLIEATKTMLADSKFPTTFWAEAVNTACYVQNKVLVIKHHNKTPYELFHSRTPSLILMSPFGCPVTILNTLDHLGKFNRKANEGFFVGYFMNIKAFRVFNSRTKIIEETLHITFLENKPNIAGSRPTWLFDMNTLTKFMNYKPVVAGNQSNGSVGKARMKTVPDKDYILLPLWTQDLLLTSSCKDSPGDGFKPSEEEEKKDTKDPGNKDNERAIGTKWIYKNKKDERGIVVTNKARLVAQGYTQEEGIDYDETEEKVYVCQPPGFKDLEFPDKVYKVENSLYDLHQAPKAWKEMCTEFEKIMHKKFQMSSMEELTFLLGLQTASTSMETSKPLMKDENSKDVCAYARFQVTPKVSHLHVVKRIFRCLKVVNAARNYEILHERDDQDTERPDKRQRSGDRHQPTSQQSSHRSHGQNNDRHGSDMRGGNDNHRGSNNNNSYSSSNNR
nr:retrovirus-related Pol polyprotein from transposon TNT 1-94 [Tanacetum cinerariifolium]